MTADASTVAVPAALARRPRWKGLPVPYVQYVDENGVVDFRITDIAKTLECSRQRLCGLCGESLFPGMAVFIGGPRSAEGRAYSEPPYHPACVRAAMRLCPFIVSPKTKRASDAKLEGQAELMPADEGWLRDKPDEWVLSYCRDWSTRVGMDGSGKPVQFVNVPDTIKLRRFRYAENGELKEENA